MLSLCRNFSCLKHLRYIFHCSSALTTLLTPLGLKGFLNRLDLPHTLLSSILQTHNTPLKAFYVMFRLCDAPPRTSVRRSHQVPDAVVFELAAAQRAGRRARRRPPGQASAVPSQPEPGRDHCRTATTQPFTQTLLVRFVYDS